MERGRRGVVGLVDGHPVRLEEVVANSVGDQLIGSDHTACDPSAGQRATQ